MRVSVRRSGGIAGLTLARDVHSSTLDAREAATFVQLVADARATAVPDRRPLPDAYQYDVEIDGVAQTIREPDAPAAWMRLIDWVLTR